MTEEPARRLGRPDQQGSEDLVRHILATATQMFIARGYAATSIEQIAAAAGSGKQTIYRRFSSKEALFTSVINQQSEKLIEAARAASVIGGSPLEALAGACRSLLDFARRPEMVALQRVLVAETGRFPELGETVLDNCMAPFKTLFDGLILAAAQAGDLHLGDPQDPSDLHDLLIGLMAGWPMHQALLGLKTLPDEAALDHYFKAAWRLFLNGARTASRSPAAV